jgi:hypothetical protein
MQQSLTIFTSMSFPARKAEQKTNLDSWRRVEERGVELKAIGDDVLRDLAPQHSVIYIETNKENTWIIAEWMVRLLHAEHATLNPHLERRRRVRGQLPV